jgi:photosystem II stability/assembly factor-like uncharacterized protein
VSLVVALTAAGCGGERVRLRHVTGHIGALSESEREHESLDQVAFADDRHGLMTTAAGDVLRSDDGGADWTRVRAGIRPRDLQAASPRVALGIAPGCRPRCHVLRTDDRGAHWRSIAVPALGVLSVVDARRWFVARFDVLRVTSDGGRSWTRRTAPCAGDRWWALAFFSARDGYAVCGDEPGPGSQTKHLRRTRDGGRTWTSAGVAPPQYGYVADLRFRNARDGLLATERGGIYATSDGGAHWSRGLTYADELEVSSISLPPGRHAFAVIRGLGLFGSPTATGTGSRVFPHSDPPPAGPFAFASERDGIAVDYDETSSDGAPTPVEATSDGGRTWTSRGTLTGISDVPQLVRTGARTVWAVATAAVASNDRVERSDDDGATWRTVFASAAHAQTSIAFASSRVGFVSTGTELLRTTDGGSRWTRVGPAGIRLDGGRFASAREGWAEDERSRFVRTTDGGRTWRAVALPVAETFDTVAVTDARHWLLLDPTCDRTARRGGCPSDALRTGDGGRSWDAIRIGAFDGPVDAVGPGLLVTDDAGAMLRSTDGGADWRAVAPANEVRAP